MIIKENELEINYVWCLHCERTYKVGEHRIINDYEMCPYEGCEGDLWDGMSWEDMYRHHPEYPEIPVKGIVYHQ